jgi:hypothetical protein
MYPARAPNVRMKLEDIPGRPSGALPSTAATISYRVSEASETDKATPNSHELQKARSGQAAKKPARLIGTLSTRKR